MSTFDACTRLCLLLVLLLLLSGLEARQVRINRYAATVQEDETATNDDAVVVATVRELKQAPYPAAGYRPDRAFLLPGEENVEERQNEDAEENSETDTGSGSDLEAVTTDTPLAEFTTRSTDASDLETTTLSYEFTTESSNDVPDERAGRNLIGVAEKATPIEQATEVNSSGSDTPLLVVEEDEEAVVVENETPIDNNRGDQTPLILIQGKAPYPPAGYRPSRVFRLPTEEEEPTEQAEASSTDAEKAKHPVCGVSTNPLAPKPAAGAKDDPDAERVAITVPIAPVPVLVTRAPTAIPLIAVRSQPQTLLVQPQMMVSRGRRPLVYATQLRRW